MSSESKTVSTQKRRGPAPTGKGEMVGVRIQPDLLAGIDRFIAEERSGLTRPQAIRVLTGEALEKMGLVKPTGR